MLAKPKQMKTHLLLLAIVVIAACCTPKEKLNKEAIEQEVRTMLKAYDDSVRIKGLEGEFFFLDNSDEFYWVPPGYKYAINYDSVATILHQNAPSFDYIDNNWDTLRILPLSKNYASFTGIVKSVSITTENDTIRMKLSETGLVVKRKTGWKLLSGQTNMVRE